MKSAGTGDVGLCLTCRHARIVESRTSRFWLCRLSASDPRFPKYPRLPVLACDGYERAPEGEPPARDPGD
jgi:hypothetical protein